MEDIILSNDVEYSLIRDVTSKSFFRFVQEFWGTLIFEKPQWNWHIPYLCNELQAVVERVMRNEPKPYDLLINVPPSTSKSTLLSIMLPVWAWVACPHLRIFTCSYSAGLAYDFSRKSSIILNSDKFKQCFPDIRLQVDQALRAINTKMGERYAVGTGGGITGKHAHLVLLDDLLRPDQTLSDSGLMSASNWLHETVMTRVVDSNVSAFIMVMQRLHQNDPAGDWLEMYKDGGLKHICLPADINDGQMVKPEGLRKYYQDGLLDPVRLPQAVLQKRRMQLGEYGYSNQYDQHPIPRSGGMFLTERLNISAVDPSDPITCTVRYWDKAISTSKTACYTVGVKLGKTKSKKFYVLDVIRGRWDSDARERLIRRTAEADGRHVIQAIEQEPGPIWEDEMVLRADGTSVKLRDVVVGDYVINRYGTATKVTAVHMQGNLPCLGIKTDSGRTCCAAYNHPFLTPIGYVDAGKLSVGDILALRSEVKTEKLTFPVIDFSRNYFPDPIVSITDAGELPCRCLTVAEGESFLVNDIVVHNSGGLESALNTVRNLEGFTCKIDKADTHKETRAEPFSSQVNGYNVTLIPANWNQEYIGELQYFPNSKYKDQVDASSGAFNLIATMSRRVAGGW